MKNIGCCLILALGLVACSDGGGRQIGGSQCLNNPEPIPMKVDPKDANQKVIVGDLLDITAQLPAGDYAYVGADIFYNDNVKGLKLHFADARNEKDGKFYAKITCVRNYKAIKGLDLNLIGIKSMTVPADNKPPLLILRDYKMGFNEQGQRILEFVDANDGTGQEQAPSKPFSDNNSESKVVQQALMVKIGAADTNYQFRSSYIVYDNTTKPPTQRGTLYILTSFTRTDLKVPPPLGTNRF